MKELLNLWVIGINEHAHLVVIEKVCLCVLHSPSRLFARVFICLLSALNLGLLLINTWFKVENLNMELLQEPVGSFFTLASIFCQLNILLQRRGSANVPHFPSILGVFRCSVESIVSFKVSVDFISCRGSHPWGHTLCFCPTPEPDLLASVCLCCSSSVRSIRCPTDRVLIVAEREAQGL